MGAEEKYHLLNMSIPKLLRSELMFVSAAERYGYGVATRMARIHGWEYQRVLDILGVSKDYIKSDDDEAANDGGTTDGSR